VVAPDTTLQVGATAQFRAVVKDAGGNVLTVPLVWSVINPVAGILAGTIIPTTGFFTAGNTINNYPNSVQACVGTTTLCDQASVTVISPPAPPALGGFTVLARQAVTCTDGSINGDVGTFQAAPTGSITQTTCPITAGTPQVGTAASIAAYNNYLTAYAARAPQSGDCDVTHTLTGSLAGVTLAPGVYCFTAAASLTGLLTLNGPPTGLWLFKIGTSGTGGLTGNSFTVLMAGGAQACNVTWWVAQAAAMTDSFFKGTILAGAGITLTRTDQIGNTWAGASGVGDVTFTGPGNPVIGCP
jgi:Ice-binding-like